LGIFDFQSYIRWERGRGEYKACRTLFRKSVNLFAAVAPSSSLSSSSSSESSSSSNAGSDIEQLCQAWVEFERQVGNVQTLTEARQKCVVVFFEEMAVFDVESSVFFSGF
jgi:hypothetical protein